MNDVFPVIMAGGSGTRFWPLSRSSRPKQFLALTSKRPLITETLARMKGVATESRSYVVCGERHAAAVRKALPKLPKANVLIEPQARNTAPAIALAALHVSKKNPEGIVVVVPSDQHVADVPAFQRAVEQAVDAARLGYIVTLGISPTRPETGYGYIRIGKPHETGAHTVAAFVEKPDAARAQEYVESGAYVWNAGIFVFRADVMLQALEKHLPEATEPLARISAALGTKKASAVLKKEFAKLPSTSIDYAVAERASNMLVVPSKCGWSDVGSFNALHDVRPIDGAGNVVEGKGALVIDSSGCVVLGQDTRTLAVVGMHNVVVVDTGDAVLVLPKHKSQDVRKVVDALKAKKQLALL
ncbi:MAG: NTP transferase domain-containing protein [Archangium sp.]|nr:NTP transferase domain-containing protein [Archangium sp.]